MTAVDHAGVLKVGDTSFKSPKKASELTVNCAELKAAAKKRIDQQIDTAGVKYILHHAELTVRMTQDDGVKMLTPFRDHDVHDVLALRCWIRRNVNCTRPTLRRSRRRLLRSRR